MQSKYPGLRFPIPLCKAALMEMLHSRVALPRSIDAWQIADLNTKMRKGSQP
jgi:hypothetical protein